MKKINFLILAILFVFSSCYIYKPYQFKEVENLSPAEKNGAVSFRSDMGGAKEKEAAEQRRKTEESVQKERTKMEQKSEQDLRTPDLTEKERQELEEKEMQNKERTPSFTKTSNEDISVKNNNAQMPLITSTEDSLKIKIRPNLYYRILADGKKYKIQADQWEGDTLVSHILRKPKKVLRFHKNQIDEENLEERRFSKPLSDVITVGSYVTGGVVLLLLVL